jgi:hypothetical protein
MGLISQRHCAGYLLALLVAAGLGTQTHALDEQKDEKDKLHLCERKLCSMIVAKAPATGTVDCALTKTWASKSIKDRSEARSVAWSFGDARCNVDLQLPRSLVVQALSEPEIKLELPLHTVRCEIENGQDVTRVEFALGPKVLFKEGRAKKVWVNLKKVEGPTAIKGLAIAVAKIEDTIGLFQKDMIKGINTFMRDKCPKVARGR